MLFYSSLLRDATIDSLFVRPNFGGVHEWNIIFVRNFNDWEVEVVVSFFQFLHSHTPSSEGPDGLRWNLLKGGVFDSRSFYCALRGSNALRFPWKGVWGIKAPRRVSFFVWTTAWGKILTCDSLMWRGYALAEWCYMCLSGETVDHPLLHCEMA